MYIILCDKKERKNNDVDFAECETNEVRIRQVNLISTRANAIYRTSKTRVRNVRKERSTK